MYSIEISCQDISMINVVIAEPYSFIIFESSNVAISEHFTPISVAYYTMLIRHPTWSLMNLETCQRFQNHVWLYFSILYHIQRCGVAAVAAIYRCLTCCHQQFAHHLVRGSYSRRRMQLLCPGSEIYLNSACTLHPPLTFVDKSEGFICQAPSFPPLTFVDKSEGFICKTMLNVKVT